MLRRTLAWRMALPFLLAGWQAVWPAAEEANLGASESLARRYGLELNEGEDGGLQLDGNGVRIRGKPGDDYLSVNGLRYKLTGSGWREGMVLGKDDLFGLLDPLLQPARHIEAQGFQEVYLEVAGTEENESAAGKVVALLQAVLEGYQVKVRLDGSELPEGDFVWLRLMLAPDAQARTSRCRVLAHSGQVEPDGGVYPGEFFDSESLILATLIQTGMVLGPGAAGKGAEDGGIERGPLEGFLLAFAPAVCVEWGGALDPEHVAKSLAAGVLRYQRFLASDARSRGAPNAFGRRQIKLSRVDLRDGPGAQEVQFLLSMSGKATDLQAEARSGIEIPSRFFVRDGDGLIRMLPPCATQLAWGQISEVPGDETAIITARASMNLPDKDFERLKTGFWGYAVWLLRGGIVEDRRATPDRLTDQLWRWEQN